MLMRDLKLLEYALSGQKRSFDAPALHFSTISTAAAVRLVREAKAKGLPVSCDVAAHQIALDDSALVNFETHFKVNPPFRSQADIAALWEGLADGTIDAIVSDHQPHDEESKNLEFDLADFGITGLETAFSVVNSHNSALSLNQLIDKFTHRPRQILRLPPQTIEVGAVACLTVFDPTLEWTFDKSLSKSKNSPFFGQTFRGKAVMILNA
jgi:dihydroorotase